MTDPANPSGYRVWILTGYDPATGAATRPVAAAGTTSDRHPDGGDPEEAVSWIPLEHIAAQRWRAIVATATVGLTALLERWMVEADGITIDVAELAEIPAGADLRGAVEMVVDELLTQELTTEEPTTEGLTTEGPTALTPEI